MKEFWDSNETAEESYETYIFRTSSDEIKQFIIKVNGESIGYIQYYFASKVGDGWWEGYPDDIVGLDLYIGDRDYLNRGLGQHLITKFIEFIKVGNKVSKTIVDPSPKNERAIKCFIKSGFVNKGEIDTPDGRAVLMERIC